MELPELQTFRIERSPYPLVDPSTLPAKILMAVDEFMKGKTVCHPVYIYVQDWQEFCCAVERGDIEIQVATKPW